MDSAYEWLYTHYCKLYRERMELRGLDMAPEIREARALLLSGDGDEIDREDALDLLCLSEGMTAFAFGMQFCYHLMTDITFPQS